jgi:hypothetical protein
MITINVDIKFDGKYKPVELFKILNDGIRKRLPKGLAKSYYTEIISNIDSNKYGFTLSSSWLALKRRMGWGTVPFIAEGYYKQAIKVFNSEGHFVVGFRKTAKHPRTGLTFGNIAVLLEYGRMDTGLPPRPLWRFSSDDFFKNKAAKFIKQEVQEIIKNSIKNA